MLRDYEYDITALGESLIDFVPSKQEGAELSFIGNAGGAPANLLSAAAKFGMRCALIGKVGKDVFGRYLQKVYLAAKIDVSALAFSDTNHTTISFVSLDKSGDREFFFYRNETADCMLKKEDISPRVLQSSKIFHFGSISMTSPCGREATLFAADMAKKHGALLSFDPNYRQSLWESAEAAKEAFVSGCTLADMIKLSEEELCLLSEEEDVMLAAKDVMERYRPALLVVTRGPQGAFCITRDGVSVQADAYDVNTVDTTGAGDAFFGAFLSGVIRCGKQPDKMSEEELGFVINMASACGSLSTASYGAIPSIPTREDVLLLLKRKNILPMTNV